ncbi:MAG: ComEC/Rec2 family competence protein [Mangrovibacterium sp.]
MKFFRNHPFVKLLSFQLAGICMANFLPVAGKLFLVLPLALVLLLVKLIKKKKYPYDLIHSAILSFLIVTISFINVRNRQDHPHIIDDELRYFEAQMLTYPVEKTNSLQAVIKILQANSSPLNRKKVIVYLEKGNKALQLRAGDRIFAKATISEIKNSGNPFEFNYRNYMSRKHICYRAYIASENYTIEKNDRPSIWIAINRFQEKLVSGLKKGLSSDQAFQIVSALALGYRDELTRETQSYFISTGAMHVLSVSGLHVAMVFLFLNFLFAFLKRSYAWHFLYFFIIVICLWGYALLTGFSPPAQRATIMFTFILAGNSLNRPASIYNSIAASAFFLLLFDPDLFFDVGFQLSYMAVVSIVFFYAKFTKLIKTENRILKYTWQLLCISIAAQIGTFPLSIYYFNQFPVYFWLSNFIVVPAGYLILGLTGAFFAFSHFENVTLFVAQLLCSITDFTLLLLKKIGELPFAVIEGLSISFIQFTCLFLVLGFSIFFIVYKKHAFFFAGLLFLFLFQFEGLTQKINLFNQRKLIVYQSKERLIHLINGRTNYLITDSKNSPNPFLYKNVLLKLKLKEPLIIHTDFSDQKNFGDLIIQRPVIQFTDKSLILEQDDPIEISPENSITFSSGILDLSHIERNKIHLQPDWKEKN